MCNQNPLSQNSLFWECTLPGSMPPRPNASYACLASCKSKIKRMLNGQALLALPTLLIPQQHFAILSLHSLQRVHMRTSQWSHTEAAYEQLYVGHM